MRLHSTLGLAAICTVLLFACRPQEKPNYWPDQEPSDTTSTPADSSKVDPIDEPEQPETPEEPKGNGVLVIVGGGASGVSAAIQASRLGVETHLIEECPWLGGMLTSAGVSAVDGNYNLRAGIFAEFVTRLANYYGSLNALKTGWVSNIMFEPKVGEEILESMCSAESKLTIHRNTRVESIEKLAKGWKVNTSGEEGAQSYTCSVLIDATELGDIAKAAGVKYRVGMDSPSLTGESAAVGPNNVVQDLTMVMTIKNYGYDVTISKPEGYNESLFVNCCKNSLNTSFDTGQTLWEPSKMMSYGQTPKGKIMLNWPIFGNDYYVNMVDMTREQREEAVRKAKNHSLGYLYFIQTRLGYKTYGLADDEYPSEDNFPFIPYHRESRRIEGEYLFTVDEAADPFSVKTAGYRTGIAVGDYPVDHHHYQYPAWRDVKINFPKIKPFTVPLGCLVPLEIEDLIVAEKSISVSNLINGSTRLQPVTLELGQAAAVLAATAIANECNIREVSIRDVQQTLLKNNVLLQPYLDAMPGSSNFEAIQKIGCTGIMRGLGETVGWSNKCNFRISEGLKWSDLYLEEYYGIAYNSSSTNVTGDELTALVRQIRNDDTIDMGISGKSTIRRNDAAVLLNTYLDPFSIAVDWSGNLQKTE